MATPNSPQSTQQSLTLIKRLFDEVYTKGNLNLIDELIASDVRRHDPARTQHETGIQSFKEMERIYKQAFPNKKLKIDDIMAVDDKVVVHWTLTGTHKGDLEGIPATNRDFKVTGITMYRLANGKVTELWQSWDRLGLLEQIGEVERASALH